MSYFHQVGSPLRRTGARLFCKKCERESAFFRSKCLECGTLYVSRKGFLNTGKLPFGTKRKIAKQFAGIRNAKYSSLKKQAEQSRARFAGVEPAPSAPGYTQDDVMAFMAKKARREPA